jgi:hypothetical protein
MSLSFTGEVSRGVPLSMVCATISRMGAYDRSSEMCSLTIIGMLIVQVLRL